MIYCIDIINGSIVCVIIFLIDWNILPTVYVYIIKSISISCIPIILFRGFD